MSFTQLEIDKTNSNVTQIVEVIDNATDKERRVKEASRVENMLAPTDVATRV
ncbi:1420_t:CDS:2 [Funneliformis mosseae]|uniref:1420_t:CDS:1 n=1 Tax=Funneliformis mosseae TaxID=27381 RepID=A0A9N8Z8I0_FUNMO|nr:1420_t:CDS:2 [Funneliformis mosseae]